MQVIDITLDTETTGLVMCQKGTELPGKHDVIQIVMGWQDYHLHEFLIGKKVYTEIGPQMSDMEVVGEDEGDFRLSDLIKRKPAARCRTRTGGCLCLLPGAL